MTGERAVPSRRAPSRVTEGPEEGAAAQQTGESAGELAACGVQRRGIRGDHQLGEVRIDK